MGPILFDVRFFFCVCLFSLVLFLVQFCSRLILSRSLSLLFFVLFLVLFLVLLLVLFLVLFLILFLVLFSLSFSFLFRSLSRSLSYSLPRSLFVLSRFYPFPVFRFLSFLCRPFCFPAWFLPFLSFVRLSVPVFFVFSFFWARLFLPCWRSFPPPSRFLFPSLFLFLFSMFYALRF